PARVAGTQRAPSQTSTWPTADCTPQGEAGRPCALVMRTWDLNGPSVAWGSCGSGTVVVVAKPSSTKSSPGPPATGGTPTVSMRRAAGSGPSAVTGANARTPIGPRPPRPAADTSASSMV